MHTYQDYLAAGDAGRFIARAIAAHTRSEGYELALAADAYDRQRNITVNRYTKFISEHSDSALVNASAANNRIPSNFFHQLNVQRCAYLLGNGVSFMDASTKARLGARFDRDFYHLARLSLIHGVSYGFWNRDRLHVFPMTQFVELPDAHTGELRAGIRFWSVGRDKPMRAVLYTPGGATDFREVEGGFEAMGPARPYVTRGEDYGGRLPVIRMYGSDLRQSTLVGMRAKIDAYDLIQSGFANDLQDCAQIYWIIENCGGMRDEDLRRFLNKLTRDHVAVADTRGMGAEASSLKPYVQEVPFESRMAWLQFIRASIYEGFGALDVHALSAGSRTATEIDAAYQPLDEAADDFEWQCSDAIAQLLALIGIQDEPVYKRNRVANQYEQTRTVLLARDVLDRETLLRHLPWLTVDEVERIVRGQG